MELEKDLNDASNDSKVSNDSNKENVPQGQSSHQKPEKEDKPMPFENSKASKYLLTLFITL